jgi:hypothetical protein
MDIGEIVLCFPAEEVFISPKIPNWSPQSPIQRATGVSSPDGQEVVV